MPYIAYRFRLNPNMSQERELLAQLETLRQVYNMALGWWNDNYQAQLDEGISPKVPARGKLYSVFKEFRNLQIADAKAGGAGPHWLTKVSSYAMRDTIARLYTAWANYFRGLRTGENIGRPNFKRFGKLKSIPNNNYGTGVVLRDKKGRPFKADVPSGPGYRLELFGVGRIKCRVHRNVVGVIKTACVEREGDGKWYVILTAQTADVYVPPKDGPAIGIDLGLEHFLTDSDGNTRPNPRYYRAALKTLATLQRSVSRKREAAKARKQKFRECKNLNKADRAVARAHVRVSNLRKEQHHTEANRLVRRAGTICVEDLNVKAMVRNNKLSRPILDAGWSGFLVTLGHKAAKAGVRVVRVDPCGTSQTCPECGGRVAKDLRVRTHDCPHCGYKTFRDHASARVILARGVAGGGPGQRPGPA